MAGFIELIAKIKPKNNGKYALVDDVDVEMEDGTRLSDAIKKPKIPSGGKKGQLLAKKSDNDGDGEWVDGLKMEDVDKKLEGKLDKNLGSENPDKVLTTDSQGNIVLQDKEDFEGGGVTDYNGLNNRPSINGVTLTGNKTSADLDMYTKEEVDKMLYEKMDKPYAPITITNDTTIEDCLDGYFKIDKIKGNTYQAQETDIVPTPQRPVPINSRKTIITKINPNVFDLEKESDTSGIPDTGTYRSIGQYQLKANTKYIFSWSEATVPAKSTLSFQIQDNTGTVLVSPFTYFNISSDEKEETGKDVEFTTDSSGIIKFAYNCIVGTSSSLETYQQYWYTKILKDISLKEDVEYEPKYVELRSLKESVNIWDNTNIASYDGEGIQFQGWNNTVVKLENSFINLKTNTKYAIKMDVEMVEAIVDDTLTQFSLNKRLLLYRPSSNEFGLPLVSIPLGLYDSIMSNGEVQSISATFTSPEDLRGVVISGYTERWLDSANNQYCAIVKFKNIMLVEGDSAPSSYVAPTVRDYKIVDHTNKTAKIVRNVVSKQLEQNDITGMDTNYAIMNDFGTIGREKIAASYNDKMSYNDKVLENQLSNLFTYSGAGLLELYIKDYTTLEEYRNWVEQNKPIMQTATKTTTEESILYIETDTSEVGYSWQDTTSPSPTIKSEVKGVEKIDILRTGKNLFDIDYVSNLENWTYMNTTDAYYYIPIKVPKGKQLYLSNDKTIASGRGYYANISPYKDKNAENYYFFYHNASGSAYGKFDRLTKDEVVYLRINNITVNLPLFIEDFKHLQIEVGDVATDYEPYQEQHVDITLPQPLYENDIANVESGDYEYEKQKYVVTGNETFLNDYQTQSGFYGRYFDLKNGNGVVTEKIWCNYLSYTPSSWSLASEACCQNSRLQIHLKFSNDRLGITDNTPVEEKRIAFANYLKQLYASGNPLYVVIKVTKTTQPIPPEDLTKIKSLTTDKGVNNFFINGEVKPTIEAKYPQDIASIVNKLQTKLLTLQEEVIKNV